MASQKKILLISGLDPSGNAGLIADLNMVHRLGFDAAGIPTALTAQNDKHFLAPQVVAPLFFKRQLKSLLPITQYSAIKIGMLGNEKIIDLLLTVFKKAAKLPPIVLDPVLQSSTQGLLLNKAGQKKLWNELIPLVTLWTPNIDEAQLFAKKKIINTATLEEVANQLWKDKKIAVLLKGGHLKGNPTDLLLTAQYKIWKTHPRNPKKLRGTGCRLSTLITGYLAHKLELEPAVQKAWHKMNGWIQTLQH